MPLELGGPPSSSRALECISIHQSRIYNHVFYNHDKRNDQFSVYKTLQGTDGGMIFESTIPFGLHNEEDISLQRTVLYTWLRFPEKDFGSAHFHCSIPNWNQFSELGRRTVAQNEPKETEGIWIPKHHFRFHFGTAVPRLLVIISNASSKCHLGFETSEFWFQIE